LDAITKEKVTDLHDAEISDMDVENIGIVYTCVEF
jgi:hypothetical protein